MTPQDYLPEGYSPEPEQQEPPQSYDYSPILHAPDASFAKQVDPKGMLVEIKHILRGDSWDDEGKKWKSTKHPQINEIGITSIMADLYPIINQNTTLSELDKEEISKVMISIAHRIVVKLAVSGEDFGIDESNYSTVLDGIRYQMLMTLKRSQEGGERKLWRTTIRSTDTRVSRPPEEKRGGFLSRFTGR